MGCPTGRGHPGLVSWAAGEEGTAYLFGLHRGCAAVPTIVVAEGSVVDGITIIVSHEGLEEERGKKERCLISILKQGVVGWQA